MLEHCLRCCPLLSRMPMSSFLCRLGLFMLDSSVFWRSLVAVMVPTLGAYGSPERRMLITSKTLVRCLAPPGSLTSVFGLWQRVRLSCHTSMTSWLPLDWVGAMVARLERKSAAGGTGKTAGAGEGAEGGEKES